MINPIISKEIKQLLRSRQAFGLQLAYIGILCLVAIIIWPRGGIYSLSSLASRDLFTVLSLGQLILVALFSPAFTATAITVEKERGTFDMLFASPLRPRAIIFGKLISSITILLLLIFSSLPVMSVCFLLGGVSLTELIQAVQVLIVATVLFGLIGLCISAISNRSYSATLATYIVILFLSAGPWIPAMVLANWREGAFLFNTIRSVSPFTAMLSISQPDLLRAYGQYMASAASPLDIFMRFSSVAMPLLIICFIVMIKKSETLRPQRREVLIRDRALLARRRRRFPFVLLDPLKEKSMIRRIDNPVSVKEVRNSTMGRAKFMIRAMYLCFIFSMILIGLASGSVGVWSPDAIKVVAICFQVGMIILIAPSLTAGAITQEKEHYNYDLLKMTLLHRHTIIIGKIVVPLRYMLFLILSTLPAFGMLWYLDYYSATRVIICVSIILTTLLFALISGIFSSALCRTTSNATAWSYGIVSLLSIGTLIGIFIRSNLSSKLFEWIMVWNPFVAAITAVTDSIFTELSIWPKTLIGLGAVSLIMLVATVLRFDK